MDNIRKLPAQLNTTWGLGHTINTNFKSLEELYRDLKVAFASLNFIQFYGEIPYIDEDVELNYWEDKPQNSITEFKGKILNYKDFDSTVPGSAYLAMTNIVDVEWELIWLKDKQIPQGTFIVSTIKGWKTYNPVYTTNIYKPKSLLCTGYDNGKYEMTYTYDFLPVAQQDSATITTTYIDTTEKFTNDYSIWEHKIFLTLSYPLSPTGVNVRLIDPEKDSSLLTYRRVNETQIMVTFFAVIDGTYSICVDYGIRPGR